MEWSSNFPRQQPDSAHPGTKRLIAFHAAHRAATEAYFQSLFEQQSPQHSDLKLEGTLSEFAKAHAASFHTPSPAEKLYYSQHREDRVDFTNGLEVQQCPACPYPTAELRCRECKAATSAVEMSRSRARYRAAWEGADEETRTAWKGEDYVFGEYPEPTQDDLDEFDGEWEATYDSMLLCACCMIVYHSTTPARKNHTFEVSTRFVLGARSHSDIYTTACSGFACTRYLALYDIPAQPYRSSRNGNAPDSVYGKGCHGGAAGFDASREEIISRCVR